VERAIASHVIRTLRLSDGTREGLASDLLQLLEQQVFGLAASELGPIVDGTRCATQLSHAIFRKRLHQSARLSHEMQCAAVEGLLAFSDYCALWPQLSLDEELIVFRADTETPLGLARRTLSALRSTDRTFHGMIARLRAPLVAAPSATPWLSGLNRDVEIHRTLTVLIDDLFLFNLLDSPRPQTMSWPHLQTCLRSRTTQRSSICVV
jgi:hypothetical protein